MALKILAVVALLLAVANAGYIGGYGHGYLGGGYLGGGYLGGGHLIGGYSSSAYIPGPTVVKTFTSTPIVKKTILHSPGYGYGGPIYGGYGYGGYGYGGYGYGGGLLAHGGW